MKDHPIIFSAPMVLALLNGRKTMTRRLAWRTTVDSGSLDRAHEKCVSTSPLRFVGGSPWQKVKPGDRLWVRESGLLNTGGTRLFIFDATPGRWWTPNDGGRFGASYGEAITRDVLRRTHKVTPSIHMPRWASRLTLEVTAVKIEKLEDISEEDAKAEGVPAECMQGIDSWAFGFERLWESLHGPDTFDQREVVALTFTVHQRNIDALEKAA